jgi:putative addiction module component (TIGR02574 family)
MITLAEVQRQADALSVEEKAGLLSHLLDSLANPPSGPGDEEVARRVEEMDSGKVQPISHEQFLAEVGRK